MIKGVQVYPYTLSLRIVENLTGKLFQEFSFAGEQKPEEVVDKALFFSISAKKFYIDHNRLSLSAERVAPDANVRIKCDRVLLQIDWIVRLKLMFRKYLKRRKENARLTRLFDCDLAKGIVEEFEVASRDVEGRNEGTVEAVAVLGPEKSITFQSEDVS